MAARRLDAARAVQKAMITIQNVHLKDAHNKTPQFWLIWLVLCLNVSAGIGIIGAASPMLPETLGGALFHDPAVGFGQFSDAQKTLPAAIGGGSVGLFSLFNIGGRFFWASLSDSIGRKQPILRSSSSALYVTPAHWRSRAWNGLAASRQTGDSDCHGRAH